jgi:hypothetical protein
VYADELGRAFPNEHYLECMQLAGLAMHEQEAFGWDLEQVRQLLSGQGANYPSASLSAELPFRVQIGSYYLINPADDSDDPFWIGQCCAAGILSHESLLVSIPF